MTLRCKIDCVLFLFFLNICAFNVFFIYKEIIRNFDFLFFFDIKFLLMRFIVILITLIEHFAFILTIKFYNNFLR